VAELCQNPTLELRDRQQWAVRWLFDAYRQGYRCVLLVMPTGAGKRYCAVYLCQVAVQNERTVLFVTNRRLLVSQMFKEAGRFGVDHGVIMSATDAGNVNAPIQIASIQTLESRYMKPGMGARHGVGLPPANLIIIDEGHQDVDRYVELLKNYPDAKVCILTATPVGSEGKSLVPPYDTIVEGCLNSELIGDGLLLPTTVYAPSEPNIQGVKIVSKGEFNQGQLGRAVKECTVFADVFNEWAPFADRKTVCFVPGVAYGNDLVEQFNRRLGAGQAYMIHAKTKPEEREDCFAAITDGRAKILVSVDVLREGFDLPVLSCGVDLQPNSQLRSYWQKLGRIKRAHDGQSEAIWLDFAGNYWRFPHPNEDPIWPTGEETTQEAIERHRQEGKERQPLRCPKCRTAYTPSSSPPKCPACGCVIEGEPKRVVRMGNGKLKQIPAVAKKQREKTEAERKLGIWKSALFGGLRTGRSFHGCAAIYRNKTGEWPRDGWPGTFPKESLAWKRSVSDVLTPRDLAIQCSKVLKGCEK
jgi:superfamily II DNA or RNA helicase